MSATACLGSEIDRKRKVLLENLEGVATSAWETQKGGDDREKIRKERIREARSISVRRLMSLGVSPAEADRMVSSTLKEVADNFRQESPG